MAESEIPSSETQESTEAAKSPLQRLKERQASQQKNRAAKEKRPDPTANKSEGGGSQATPKQMRSSANKQGG